MNHLYGMIFALVTLFAIAGTSASAQLSEICGETGATPWLNSPFVYGKVLLSGFEPGAKLPKVTVVVIDRRQVENSFTIGPSGNYCFRDINASGGSLVIQVEGVEMTRRSLGSSTQHREDFEMFPSHPDKRTPPGTVSVKYSHPRDEKNTDLLKKADEAEKSNSLDKAIKYLRDIVYADANDFIAWAKLGAIYFGQNNFGEAEAAFRTSLGAKPDYTPAMLNLGRTLLVQKQAEAAVAVLEKATVSERSSARAWQLLGEAYLLARKGTLGVQALNEAIKLDPKGMAESHLLIARLYDLAGAKNLASREYKTFLTKVPDYPEKKKLEKYIKDNPE